MHVRAASTSILQSTMVHIYTMMLPARLAGYSGNVAKPNEVNTTVATTTTTTTIKKMEVNKKEEKCSSGQFRDLGQLDGINRQTDRRTEAF